MEVEHDIVNFLFETITKEITYILELTISFLSIYMTFGIIFYDEACDY